MEKSIESIWKDGFLNSEDLIIPKVNNMYNRKSKLLINKLKRTMKIDHWAIIPMTVVGVIYIIYAGSIAVAMYFFILMVILFIVGQQLLNKLETLDTTVDSFQYLTTFNTIVKSAISRYTKMFIFVYPFFILPIYWVIFKDESWFAELIQEPLELLALYLFMAIVALSITGYCSYKFAVKLVYGRLLKKLKEIIADMEELRT